MGFNQGEYGAENNTFTLMRLAVSSTMEWEWIFALSKYRMMFLSSYSGLFIMPISMRSMKCSNTVESTPPSMTYDAITFSKLMADNRLTEYYSRFTSDFYMFSCSAIRPYYPIFRYLWRRTRSIRDNGGWFSGWVSSSTLPKFCSSLLATDW